MNDSIQPPYLQTQIQFSNLKSLDLFGAELSQMSYRQLVLPQFIPVSDKGKMLEDIIKDKKTANRLRRRISEFLWTG